MSFTIDDDVELPARSSRGSVKNPNSFSGVLRRLRPGQSVFGRGKTIESIGSMLQNNRKSCPAFSERKYTSCTVTENGVKGVRVWRVK